MSLAPALARPLWLALLAMATVLLMSPGSLLCLPGIGAHLPKVIEIGAILALVSTRRDLLVDWPAPLVLGVLYVVHAAISGSWAPYPESYSVAIWKLLHAMLLAPILCFALRRIRDVTVALVVFKCVSLATSLVAIAQWMLPALQFDALSDDQIAGASVGMALTYGDELASGAVVRVSGTLGHSNALSLFLAGSMCLQPWLWQRFRSRRMRAWILGTTLCELLAMLFTHGRLGVIAIVAGGAWFLARGGARRPFVVALAAFAAFALSVPFLPATWIERVLDPSHYGKSDSITGRMELQTTGLEIARDHGFLGAGYGQFGQLFYERAHGHTKETFEYFLGHTDTPVDIDDLGAHDVYLEVWAEQGVIGLVTFCGAGVLMVWQLIRLSKRTPHGSHEWMLCLCLESLVIAYAVASVFIHTQEMKIIWIALGLVCGWLRIGNTVANRCGS